jgi:hypothetical protein
VRSFRGATARIGVEPARGGMCPDAAFELWASAPTIRPAIASRRGWLVNRRVLRSAPGHAKTGLASFARPAASVLGFQSTTGGSLTQGAMWAAGRSLPDMSLAFALVAAINGSTGSRATLSYCLYGTKPRRRQPGGARFSSLRGGGASRQRKLTRSGRQPPPSRCTRRAPAPHTRDEEHHRRLGAPDGSAAAFSGL